MPLRLLPWAPEFGTSMQFDTRDELPAEPPDITIERETWAPVTPAGDAPGVQIIDGVRRAEAHAMDDGPDGEPRFGLFGSFAVGAVRCDARGAAILDETLRVERRYLHDGEEAEDRTISAGRARLAFLARRVPGASTANALVAALNRAMLDEEARLADELSRDESLLTLVDGPLRGRRRPPGRRVVGYIKRIQQWYIGREATDLLPTLRPGERTPLFHISDAPGDDAPGSKAASGRDGRYSWFLRIADLGEPFHNLGGVMRLETPGDLPVPEAIRLADETALAIPRLASSPVRDPRAPQNLTPVGALEARLTHRLGDRRWVRRLITRDLARAAADAAPRLTRTAATR